MDDRAERDDFEVMMRGLDELRTRPVPLIARLQARLAWLLLRLLARA